MRVKLGIAIGILGLAVLYLPMATTSWIGILTKFDVTVCAGFFTGLTAIGIILYFLPNKFKDDLESKKAIENAGVMSGLVGIIGGTVCGIIGLIPAYEKIATLNSAFTVMSVENFKTSIFGNIVYAATEATIIGPESAIIASVAQSPLMMGLAPEVAFGIWDGIFFPLLGLLCVCAASVLLKNV